MTLGNSRSAHAVVFYSEAAAGISYFRSADSFFGGTSGTSLQTGLPAGFGANLGFFANLTDNGSPTEFHVGLQSRYLTGSSGTETFSLASPLLALRVQVSRIYLSIGGTPIVFRQSSALGESSFQMVTGSLTGLGELGILWPVTPKFSLAAVFGAQVISTAGSLSPMPAADATILMRFYVGRIGGTGGEGRASLPNEHRGWRYPFGIEIH